VAAAVNLSEWNWELLKGDTPMYSLINQSARTIVETFPIEYVTKYEWLLQNLGQASTAEYQKRYRSYWTMNAARLSPEFYVTYFRTINTAISEAPTLNACVLTLYESSARRNGTKTLQFSFATKLLHMVNPKLPIYDSKVAAFYKFQAPSSEMSLRSRIDTLVRFHEFLKSEYARVLDQGLLKNPIDDFRNRFKPQGFTDQRVIDCLIWQTVELRTKGAIPNGSIGYR
jgi:hypothetical protein